MKLYMYYVSQHQGISFDYSYLLVCVAFYFTQEIQISLSIYIPTSGENLQYNNSNNNIILLLLLLYIHFCVTQIII